MATNGRKDLRLLLGLVLLLAGCPSKAPVAGDASHADVLAGDLDPGDLVPPPDKLACLPGMPGSWAVSATGTRDVYPIGLAVNAAGEAVITGKLAGDIAFGQRAVTARVDGEYGFIASTNSDGGFVWAQAVGDQPGEYFLPSAAIDASGRRYFTGTADHPARLGTAELPGDAGFLAAVDAEGGTAWVLPIQGGEGTGVVMGGAGDVFLAGTMSEHLEEAGAKRTRTLLGPIELSCIGDALSGFVARIDRDGKPLWGTPICAAPEGMVMGTRVAADAAGNSFIVGGFTKQIALGKHTVSAPPEQSSALPRSAGFMAQLDSQGEPRWLVPVIGEGSSTVADVAVDENGNGYVGAVLMGKTTVSDKVITPEGTPETLVAKLDATGKVAWATQLRSSETRAAGLAVAADGRSVVALHAPDAVEANGQTYDDPRREPILVVTLDADGKPTAGMRGGNPGVWPNRLRLDAAGNAYVVGTMKGAVWFGCDQLGSANRSLFLWKVGKVL